MTVFVNNPLRVVVMATWSLRRNCQASAYVTSLGSLLPPALPGTPGSFALSENGALAALVKQAGLTPTYVDDVECIWGYPDLETAPSGPLSAGPAIRAIRTVEEQTVREAVAAAIAPFKQSSGGYQLANQFRYVIAMRSR